MLLTEEMSVSVRKIREHIAKVSENENCERIQ